MWETNQLCIDFIFVQFLHGSWQLEWGGLPEEFREPFPKTTWETSEEAVGEYYRFVMMRRAVDALVYRDPQTGDASLRTSPSTACGTASPRCNSWRASATA